MRIRELVKEEKEADLMAMADEEIYRLREYHKTLFTLKRLMLGYRGRKLARERRREARLEEVQRGHGSTDAIHSLKHGNIKVLRVRVLLKVKLGVPKLP